MASGDTRDYSGYMPMSSRITAIQERLDNAETGAIERDNAVDEQLDGIRAELSELRGFCLAFGILVLVMVAIMVLLALGILRIGG